MKNEYIKKMNALVGKYKYVLIVIAVGLLLLTFSESTGEPHTESIQEEIPQSLDFSVEKEEQRISEVLNNAFGVGKAEVVLTLKTTEETIYQSNNESSISEGENAVSSDLKTETVIISHGSGIQSAVVTKQIYPEYRGALIVCTGGDDPLIKLEVTEAVSALTGLSYDKITVMRRSVQ